MTDARQIELFAPAYTAVMDTFLAEWCSLEDEEDRLREAKRLLKEAYKGQLDLRALLVAVKVVRAKDKLAAHPKEPCPREVQVQYEAVVEAFATRQRAEAEVRAQEAAELARVARAIPDMVLRAAEELARPVNGATVTVRTGEEGGVSEKPGTAAH